MDEDYKRRQNIKSPAAIQAVIGFSICLQFLPPARGPNGHVISWLGLAGGLLCFIAGFFTYLPVWREEKRELEAWKKQEKEELDAANAFLYGTAGGSKSRGYSGRQ